MDKTTLNDILLNNVVRITYIKKNGETRPMLCTKSKLILNSFEGQTVLGYRKPKGAPIYDIAATDNIIVWDIEKKDFRTIQAARVTIDEQYPQEDYYEALVSKSADLGDGNDA